MNRMSINFLATTFLYAVFCLFFLAPNIYAQPVPDITEQSSQQAFDFQSLARDFLATCASPQTEDSIPFPKVVAPLDPLFFIQGKANWLPPKPVNPDDSIDGVDADGDCVRDDIEYYIAGKHPKRNQYQLRKYLYKYAIWMRRFLVPNISENNSKTAFYGMAAAGECVGRITGDDTVTRNTLNDLFARFHNTFPRSHRYIDNLPVIGGWTTRQDMSVSCP